MTHVSSLAPQLSVHVAGVLLNTLREGALWWESERVLIVSDLHFEKGSSYAAKGQLLPPYDTAATLSLIERLCEETHPRTVISLGDSFHDRSAELRLPDVYAERIRQLTAAHDWVWVEGNHDPDPPEHLGGRATHCLRIGPLVFRHEPTGERGEVAGHLHPAVKVKGTGRSRSLRRRCFVTDGSHLVMPAMGAFTGGLNVLDEAFNPIFPEGFSVFALGGERVYQIDARRCVPDIRKRRRS